MAVVAFLLVGLAAWLIDSAVRNRAPVKSITQAITTGQLPETGVSYPVTPVANPTVPTIVGTATVTNGAGVVLPSSNDWIIDPNTNGYTGTSYNEPGMARPAGTLDDWIAQANQVLVASGSPALTGTDVQAVRLIVQNESGGNPLIINGWDSNARAGHASKGLMQDIQSTFMQWAVTGHHNIFNPVDNIVASVRYARARYGSLSQVPGVEDVNAGGGYQGY